MKQPIWIINSSLLIMVLMVGLFLLLSREKVPTRFSVMPSGQLETHVERPHINTKTIYEHDLFDTYIVVPPAPATPDYQLVVPPAPAVRPPIIPVIQPPQFLPPLNITLKGIVSSSDEGKNRAMILDNKTSQEGTYKAGDILEDARLVRIFSNKVIFVRSNGQQEILYLREKDAQSDAMFVALSGWADIIQELKPSQYSIDPSGFSDRIKSLGQFIELLDLTTVYKNGHAKGVRIGQAEKDSLPFLLGFAPADVIIEINKIAPIDTASRFKIYQEITKKPLEDKVIEIKYLRRKQPFTLTVVLQAKKQKPSLEGIKKIKAIPATREQVKEKEIKSLQEKYDFAPTLKEIRERERAHMVHNAKRIKPSIVE